MYLLDTNVISELRKVLTGMADPRVMAWARNVSASALYLSVISILELEIGILLKTRRDPPQGQVLRLWFENHVIPAFTGRILSVETAIARQCAPLHIPNPRSHRDALIAATAIVHEMVVVTRNVADFEGTGVRILNPWTDQPAFGE